MKTLTFTLAFILVLGTITTVFAGNQPALTYPSGSLVTAQDSVQMDQVTPWNKGAIHYTTGVMSKGAWYSYCPAAGPTALLSQKTRAEVKLSNGMRIMLCCKPCKADVEKDLAKFQGFMY